MSSKIYDIVPPQERKEGFPRLNTRELKKKSPLKAILIVVGSLFLLLGIVLYLRLPKAELEIQPKTNLLEFEEKITIDKEAEAVDILNKTVPAETLQEEKEFWKEFTTTGVISDTGKAHGKITVYNESTPVTPISLIPKTKFLSESGKYFVSPKSIYIPAAQKSGGEIIPSSTEIEVVALQTGEDHNIGPSEFSVPGLAGTSYYHTVYAKSSEPMTGGFEAEQPQVTEEDLQKAEQNLTQQLLTDIEVELRKKISSDYILFDDAISKQVIEISPLVEGGDLVEKFSVQGKAVGKALMFKKDDLEQFVKKYISSKIPSDKEIYEKSLKINYTPQIIDLREDQITLSLNFSVKIYPKINKEELVETIEGKSEEKTKEVIYNKFSDKISEINVNFWPFWVRRVPKNGGRVNIKLNIE